MRSGLASVRLRSMNKAPIYGDRRLPLLGADDCEQARLAAALSAERAPLWPPGWLLGWTSWESTVSATADSCSASPRSDAADGYESALSMQVRSGLADLTEHAASLHAPGVGVVGPGRRSSAPGCRGDPKGRLRARQRGPLG